MGKQAVQLQEAIPLLHDGPLYKKYHDDETNQDGVASVLDLACQERRVDLSSSTTVCAQLLSHLSSAKRIKDQLQILQAFKSSVIQLNRKRQQGKEESQDDSGKQNQGCGFSDKDWEEMIFTYEILLEWSLGCKTPLPLRRTIHSILETMYEIHRSKSSLESIFDTALASISSESALSCWQSSLDALESLLLLAQTQAEPYFAKLATSSISFLSATARSIVSRLNQQNSGSEKLISDGVQVSVLCKTILQDDRVSTKTDLEALSELFWLLLQNRLTPEDALPPLGMAYGRTVEPPDWMVFLSNQHQAAAVQKMRPLARVCLLQGLAAAVPDHVWIRINSETDALRFFERIFRDTVRRAVDPEVRLAALKGIRTLVSRSLTLLNTGDSIFRENPSMLIMKDVSDRVLDTVLKAWENPPTRKMGNSLPSVFQAVVDWKEALGGGSGGTSGEALKTDKYMHDLVDRLLQQPPYRKGKYKALECLLPKVGARVILLQQKEDGRMANSLLSDLLAGIGDSSHNSGAMADLWAKLLQSLFLDVHKLPTKQGKKNKKNSDIPLDFSCVAQEWLDTWVPSLANQLVASEWNRRKQIAAFCLPRILVMVGDRVDAAVPSFAALLTSICELDTNSSVEIPSKERKTRADRILWAIMEVTRYSAVEKKLVVQNGNPLKEAITRSVSLTRLAGGLHHFSDTIRLASFQAMEGVVQCFDGDDMEKCVCEADLWASSLQYAAKSDGKEYLSALLYRLLSFLDRLSRCEAEDIQQRSEQPTTLPVFGAFINDILDRLFAQNLTYPESVVAKETFSLALLESILVFVSRDTTAAVQSKLLPKSGALYERRRSKIEEATLKTVRMRLLSPHVIGALFSMLRSSSWDGTKSKSFESIATLIYMARCQQIQLPSEFFGKDTGIRMREQGLYLASSPRPKEAETGARLLALQGLSRTAFASRMEFLHGLMIILEERIDEMKTTLEYVLQPDTDIRIGREVPLVHGIILSLRLLLESEAFEIPNDGPMTSLNQLATTLCRSLQVSLSVVADVHAGENVEGIDDELVNAMSPSNDISNSKVNPGAIGANGIFSSVNRIDSIEHEKRLASQRIIIGSWLLTKEACASIATVLTTPRYTAQEDIVNHAGTLLISTLTSLKHTGAAYAAHSALQRITVSCLDRKDANHLPLEWIERLYREICSIEKIRDSTLRRSTGYALGFLSIMRSEVFLRSVPRRICENVTHKVLSLTLPSPSRLSLFLSTIGMQPDKPSCIFSFLRETEAVMSPHGLGTRTRVHALNVLRMMILDAPLSQEVFPLVGDAMVSAIIGYIDSEWSVRNSAGMVFSAAMLRVVDADKNAANTNLTSKNAITLTELFQSYPALYAVLLAVITACVEGTLRVDDGGSLPPILPILVLLYRVQPVDTCGPDLVERMQEFSVPFKACLGHRHLSVRQAAARAMCNLSGGDDEDPMSSKSLYTYFLQTMTKPADWNIVHGVLLLLKELVLARRLTYEDLTGTGTNVLLGLLRFHRRQLAAPPLCLMTTIQILELLPQSQHEVLAEACLSLILWVTEDVTTRLNIAGMSELATAAASAASRWLTVGIFRGSDRALEDLSCLLKSHIADVRMAATKTFKKSIYNGLDSLTESSSFYLIQSLSDSVAVALAVELSRNNQDNSNGTHPPTVRRLSRCLLEIFAAYQRFKPGFHFSSTPRMRELGLAILDCERVNIDEPTPLVGNSLELCASDVDAEDDCMGRIYFLIKKLSSAAMPWRLRYSAACATSQLWQHHMPNGLRPLIIHHLQDEDPDVRYAVSKAISTSDSGGGLSVSEHTMTNFIFALRHSLSDAEAFLNSVFERSLRVLSHFQLAIGALASDAHRKIFEEEDPNAYHEPGLEQQAMFLSLWDTLVTMDSSKMPSQLHDSLVKILSSLAERPNDRDELCRAVFSDLHLVLLTMLIYQDPEMVKLAQRILEPSSGAAHLHPSLQVVFLLYIKNECPPSREQIQSCCFLLPTTNNPINNRFGFKGSRPFKEDT